MLGITNDSCLKGDVNRSPVDLVLSRDGTWIATANQTANSVSLVRLADGVVLEEMENLPFLDRGSTDHIDDALWKDRALVREIDLGGEQVVSLARKGEAIFYNARRSLDQWYSCHSCHYEGGTNSVTMDTFNDGSAFTFKTVLPLYQLDQTGPWTWHGWQTDLKNAMTK